MHNFLKFRYFLAFLLLISCGETSTNKNTPTATEKENSAGDTESANGTKVILFFGDSLTAGYGLDPEEAFPAVIQRRLDSLQMPFIAVNSGLSGETTASGRNRLGWVLNQKADIFVLELGANDGLRGIPLTETRTNLQAIIDAVRSKNPDTQIILAGMQIPPNMGKDYTQEFKSIFPELAEKNNIPLIPFLLENVAGISDLNQGDGIHPTMEGHKIVADNVWAVLEDIIGK
ncbi:arylesterase [Spongiimicrobium sp. 3-5]|uniref:arylesterase n=1 Tax=Spongiimicrobium sp. 3-5 TaxID=3332596 RepID=UPI00398038E6